LWLQNPKNPGGRIYNTLIGQLVSLTLNIRYDDYKGQKNEKNLANFVLVADFCTDRNGGTHFHIDPAVVAAAVNVQGLLDLANFGLAGGDLTPYGVTLDQLNSAVSAINEAFDECASICLILPD
jgi:hypothetical protein